MGSFKELDYSEVTRLDLDEFTRDLTPRLVTFRHVLSLGGGTLIEAIATALGEQVALLECSPKFDLDGELYTGGSEQTAEWLQEVWSRPDNQEHAFDFAYAPTDERFHFVIPIRGYAEFGHPSPYSLSRAAALPDEGANILWAIENRHRIPWMIVPLNSHRQFLPFIFLSRDPNFIAVATRAIVELSPKSLLSVWNGPETAATE